MESVRDLTEGIDELGTASRKKLFTLLKTMIVLANREGRPLLVQDSKLLIEVVRLFTDFQVSCG